MGSRYDLIARQEGQVTVSRSHWGADCLEVVLHDLQAAVEEGSPRITGKKVSSSML